MNLKIKTMAEYQAESKAPEILFWVGDAGSYDERAKRITKAFCKVLHYAKIDFAILGKEEKSTGDFARRVGNEFLFQMIALENIKTLNSYHIKKIVTTCPHCFNTLKNEYPALGGVYEVLHHTQFIKQLINNGRLKLPATHYKGNLITYQDPCYLGRANSEYSAPREILQALGFHIIEMENCKNKAICCGAGGGQFFKEAEKGNQEINDYRLQQALNTQCNTLATSCPYCTIMLNDSVHHQQEKLFVVKDIVELLLELIE